MISGSWLQMGSNDETPGDAVQYTQLNMQSKQVTLSEQYRT